MLPQHSPDFGKTDVRIDRPAIRQPQGSRVLIVEDEYVVALDLRLSLEKLGYCVVGHASSSHAAIEKARTLKPELILMDIRLSGPVDGIQTAAILAEQLTVPIIYLTANSDSETLRRALDTSPCGFLTKPFNPISLQLAIEIATRQNQQTTSLKHENESLHQHRRAMECHLQELSQIAESLRQDATTDSLTGLYNRRHLTWALSRELEFAKTAAQPLALLMLDLDHFKVINDTYGHHAGDLVLKNVAGVLHARLRDYDISCRYGGEEIVIVLPATTITAAVAVAELLRKEIESLSPTGLCSSLRFTASFGVAAYPEHGTQPEDLLKAADAALYRAKRAGRNRVVA